MSLPRLRYGIVLTQGSRSGLTYLNTAENATITLIVSNAGDDVELDGLTPVFLFGPHDSDIAKSSGDLSIGLPTGWTQEGGQLRPPDDARIIGTKGFSLTFDVLINDAAGSTDFKIVEQTADGSAAVKFTITKMPTGFLLANLVALPTFVEPGDTVDLTWAATPGQSYAIDWQSHHDAVTPTSPLASWKSPPLKSLQPTISFTVTGRRQLDGGKSIAAQATTGVSLDVPQILSFDQPRHPYYQPPVVLHWSTENADRCQLYHNGRLINDHANANPASGYEVTPLPGRNEYRLIALKGEAATPPVTISLVYYNWSAPRTISPGIGNLRIVVSPDGARIFLLGDKAVQALDAATLAVFQTVTMVDDHYPWHGAVTADGATLYVALVRVPRRRLVRFSAYDMTRTQIFDAPVGPLALGSDGVLYTGMNHEVNAIDGNTGTVLYQFAVQAAAGYQPLFAAAPDRTVYHSYVQLFSRSTKVCRLDLATRRDKEIAESAGGSSIVCSPDGTRIYFPSGNMDTVRGIDRDGNTVAGPYKLPVPGFINNIVLDPAGAGFYANVADRTTKTLLFYDPHTGFCRVLQRVPAQYSDSADLAISPDGTFIYFAVRDQLNVISIGARAQAKAHALDPVLTSSRF